MKKILNYKSYCSSKVSKCFFALSLILIIVSSASRAGNINTKVFELINLDYSGLEKVKEHYIRKDYEKAVDALLKYYRNRSNIVHPEVNLDCIKISAKEQKMAEEGLEHRFFVHDGYQPSYFYGDDINWMYWPVKDNELRWQLHRHKWWAPMGKVYFKTKDEKYAKEWILQYQDWIRKNPLVNKDDEFSSPDERKEQLENVRFAWRPLEVSHRIQDQTAQFLYFMNSPSFDSHFLTHFLVNYHKHCDRILNNYSKKGNHLLFEAQRMIYAGVFFPEFNDSKSWRESGVSILNKEINVQVYPDGVQFELDPRYHLASINIFFKALKMANANGFRNDFPEEYINTIGEMIEAQYNLSFPDYTNPLFSDAKLNSKTVVMRNYKEWLKVFPGNDQIKFFAADGAVGTSPAYESKAFMNSGFYVLRNSWKEDATVMILKSGPPAFWHNQPDNGTFELMIKGRNFFPDAGSYVYSGNAEVQKERDWFRQTKVHKTLTLDGMNLENTDSKCLLWKAEGDRQVLVIENQSYEGLKHRRSVFFVDEEFFVIADEAIGDAAGKVSIHYQMCEGDVLLNKKKFSAETAFPDNNNVKLQVFSNHNLKMLEEEGWVSYTYREREKRAAFAFQTDKKTFDQPAFITVITPLGKQEKQAVISAKFISRDTDNGKMKIEVSVGKKKYSLEYDLK